MLILFDLNTKEIKGVSMLIADSSGRVPEPSLKTLFPKLRTVPNIGVFKAPNDEKIANEIHKYMLKFDARGNPVGLIRRAERPRIFLSTDAPDRDGDGVGEILADGETTATIVASIRDEGGKVITDRNFVVRFRASGGSLMVRNVLSETGIAKTVLRSTKDIIRVTVTAFADGCTEGKIELDFVPATDVPRVV